MFSQPVKPVRKRGPGKFTIKPAKFLWRANPQVMKQLRQLSFQYGGQKNKASVNALINLYMEVALSNEEIKSYIKDYCLGSCKVSCIGR